MNRNGAFRQLIALFVTLFVMATAPANAQELLANRSFESPVVPANGNNFYATIPSWTVTSVTPARADSRYSTRLAADADAPKINPCA